MCVFVHVHECSYSGRPEEGVRVPEAAFGRGCEHPTRNWETWVLGPTLESSAGAVCEPSLHPDWQVFKDSHSMGRSIPLHIFCIQTHQLLSITECRGKKRKWERESRGLFFLFSSMKRLFVHRPLYVEVHVLLLTFSDFFLWRGRWGQSQTSITQNEWFDIS